MTRSYDYDSYINAALVYIVYNRSVYNSWGESGSACSEFCASELWMLRVYMIARLASPFSGPSIHWGGGWYVAPKFLLASLGMNFFIGKAKNSNSSTVMVFYWRCLTKILGITLCPFKILGHGPPMNAFCVIVN